MAVPIVENTAVNSLYQLFQTDHSLTVATSSKSNLFFGNIPNSRVIFVDPDPCSGFKFSVVKNMDSIKSNNKGRKANSSLSRDRGVNDRDQEQQQHHNRHHRRHYHHSQNDPNSSSSAASREHLNSEEPRRESFGTKLKVNRLSKNRTHSLNLTDTHVLSPSHYINAIRIFAANHIIIVNSIMVCKNLAC